MDVHESKIIRQYLLGELPETERQELEQRLFADDEFFDRLLDFENELFDGYARGELSAADKQLFETRFQANPQAAEQLAFARSLARMGANAGGGARPLHRSRWLWTLAATAALLALAAGIAFERRQMPAAPPAVFAIALPTSLERGAGPAAAAVVVPVDTQLVTLDLTIGPHEPYATYSVAVRTARGGEVAKFSGLAPVTLAGSRTVEVLLQSALLPPGQYEIELSGGDGTPVGFSYLRIAR